MSEQEHKEEIVVQVQSAVAPLAIVIHEVKDVLTTHIENETNRIQSIDDRLDRHLEIYANNGKEAKRVADNLAKMMERADQRDKKVDEMYKKFIDERIIAENDNKRMKKIVLYGAVVGAFLSIVAFGKWLLK